MNDDQLLRYSRHILLPQVDVAGQQALLDAHVLVLGVGGLGSPVAMYLAAAGVGELTLLDFDTVDLSNLQRQVVHTEGSIGFSKVESARERLEQLNSGIKVNTLARKLDEPELLEMVRSADLVVDCSDRYSSRFALNRVCVAARKPLVSGAAMGLDGQLISFDFRKESSPCYACLYQPSSDEGPSCAEAGVLAPLVGVIGTMQALAAVKIIIGLDTPLAELQCFDARSSRWQALKLSRRASCEVCSA